MLELRNVTKVFNPGTVNEKIALDNFSMTLEDGEFVPESLKRSGRTTASGWQSWDLVWKTALPPK